MSNLIATFFYVGHLRPAPGTWGSLAALPVAYFIHGFAGWFGLLVAILVVFFVGWWATKAATSGKDDHDPSEIVIDEVAGQWIALLPLSFFASIIATCTREFGGNCWPIELMLDFTPLPLVPMFLAFGLFRIFDIWKVGLVGWADRLGTPLGVMLDDVIAGIAAGLVWWGGAYTLALMAN